MVVIMSHVICNALEWFPHVGHLASLSRLLYCCTCCTAVLVHQVQQICCTSTAVQPPRIGQRLLYCSTAVQLYLLYCCTCCTAVLPGLRRAAAKKSLLASRNSHLVFMAKAGEVL